MASSASTEQWILTGGSESSRTMSVFLIESASSTVWPFTHSVASGQLTQSVLDELRAEPEHFQKGAYLLKLVERALAGDGGLFPLPTVGHKRHAKSRAGATDGAMNANCSFICHVVSSSPLGGLPFHFRDVDSLFGHFIERGQFAQLGHHLHHL